MRRFRIFAVAVALGAALAVPHGSAAGTVTLDRACYTEGEAVKETGTGFSPNAGVVENLSLLGYDNSVLTSLHAPLVTADANGNFTRSLKAPKIQRFYERRETGISAFTDQALSAAAPPVTTHWTLSQFGAVVGEWRLGIAYPTRSMVLDTYGWTSVGKVLYIHYFREGLFVKTVRVGALTGSCGDLKKRVKQFPFKRVKAGRWLVFLSTTKVLNRDIDVWLRFKVRVARAKATG